ncbi:hypothetical protein H8E77_32090 [bacterium]|nr:hypothetical protein [bacterium]
MNSRERVIRSIKFENPDRIPIMHSTLIGAFLKYGDALRRLYEEYPSDVLVIGYSSPLEYGDFAGEGSEDSWGAVWLRLGDDYKGQVVRRPLDDWKKLKDYKFPPLFAEGEFETVEKTIRENNKQRYTLVDAGCLFQRMFYLRGFENLLIDLAEQREEIYRIRDRIVDYILKRIKKWRILDIDGFIFRDDWGTQERLIISPTLWREFFKPAYKQICDAVHRNGAFFHFHSDGYIRQIIPDMLEIGVDVLNPQLVTMDIDELGRTFGGKVCFRGGLDRQHILPHGSAEDVRRHVQRTIEAFCRFNGGYIGCGQVGPDVPLRNAEAMLECFTNSR